MKNIKDIFSTNSSLIHETEVQQLIEYCEELQDQIVDFTFEKSDNKQVILIDMIKEIVKACEEFEKQQLEHTRFGLQAPNFEQGISNLKKYIYSTCRENKIRI